jgi:hypothetical protein
MSLQWSFSADKLFRRCQRQFFFNEIAAHHAPKVAWRHEAFVMKQLKTLDAWRGIVIHEGIQKYVVPAIQSGHPLDWATLVGQTLERAKMQWLFSKQRRYRESGIVKSRCESYCALVPDENGEGVSEQEFNTVSTEIRTAFKRLAGLTQLWEEIRRHRDCQAEMRLWTDYDDVRINAQIDLFFQRSRGHPTIIDWKSYEVGGDSDAWLQTTLYGWIVWRCGRYEIRRPEDIKLLECQVQDGVIVEHACSHEVFEELEDHIYRSLNRIFSLCKSRKLSEAKLEDFAFTDNPNNCEHCTFRELCIQKSSAASAWPRTQPTSIRASTVQPQPLSV